MNDNQEYKNPNRKVVNPLKNKAFARYLGVSLVAIFVILIFVFFIWVAGGRKSGIPDEIDFKQLREPEKGDPIVVFETNIGTIKAALYPEETPEYYQYFKNLVDSGYYDGTYFCAVVDSAYALGGTKSPSPDATIGEDSDVTRIRAEISDNLWPITGSICSYVGQGFMKNYAGSSMIFINDIDESYMNEDALKRAYGDELGGVFAEKGGIPNFSQKYTIFAQIYDGWNVFEALMSSEVLESGQPASDIIFEHVYITEAE